jgi:hypothetical protein
MTPHWRDENGVVTFQLVAQLATTTKTLTRVKALVQIRTTTREAVECRERIGTEASRETGARQAQSLSDGSNTHARETLECFIGPAQRPQWQRHQLPDETRQLGHDKRLPYPGRHQRGERRRRQCHYGLQSQGSAFAR